MKLFKYADDIALVALVSNIDDLTRYQFVVNNLSQTLLSSTLQKRKRYTVGAESGTWAQK